MPQHQQTYRVPEVIPASSHGADVRRQSPLTGRPQGGPASHGAPAQPRPAQAPLNYEHKLIREWLESVRFKPKRFGGVDEADVWRKIAELNDRYEAALAAERARYDALLRERVTQEVQRRLQAQGTSPATGRRP